MRVPAWTIGQQQAQEAQVSPHAFSHKAKNDVENGFLRVSVTLW